MAQREEIKICPDCDILVSDEPETQAVLCDLCDTWFHKVCHNISNEMYAVLNSDEHDHINWYCKHCKRGAKKIVNMITALDLRQTSIETKMNDHIKEQTQKDTKNTKLVDNLDVRIKKLESRPAEGFTDPTAIIHEMEDRHARVTNLMFFNVPESAADSPQARAADDITTIKDVCAKDLNIEQLDVTGTTRLGRKSDVPNSPRPLKVQLNSPAPKKEILRYAGRLRSSKDPVKKNIYISADQTPMQREESKKLRELRVQRLEELRQAGDTRFTWIIREGKLLKVRSKTDDY